MILPILLVLQAVCTCVRVYYLLQPSLQENNLITRKIKVSHLRIYVCSLCYTWYIHSITWYHMPYVLQQAAAVVTTLLITIIK